MKLSRDERNIADFLTDAPEEVRQKLYVFNGVPYCYESLMDAVDDASKEGLAILRDITKRAVKETARYQCCDAALAKLFLLDTDYRQREMPKIMKLFELV